MRKHLEAFPIGSAVTVAMRYEGSGRFAYDGNEGRWIVVGHLGPADLLLAKNVADPWDVIVHLGRIIEAEWYSDNRMAS